MNVVLTDQFIEWMQDKNRKIVSVNIIKVKSG
jgi:hypothetical protein